MSRTRILGLLRTGFLYGAVFFGGTIAIVHVVYNRLPGAWDAVVLAAYLALIFGLSAGLVFVGAGAVEFILGRLSDASREADRQDLRLATTLFNFLFFVPFFLYGLTYDQTILLRPDGPLGMSAYLLSMALLIAIGSRLLSGLATAALAWIDQGRRLVVVAAILLLPGLIFPSLLFSYLDTASPQPSASRPVREPTAHGRKVVLIGLDGADWRVLDRRLALGELPTFKRLLSEGSRASLQTLAGANSAEIWAGLFTGADSASHGCRDFFRIRLAGMNAPGFYPVHRTFVQEAAGQLERIGLASRRIIDRSCLKRRPVWEILDDLGVSTGIVDGYYYSAPTPRLQHPESYVFSYALNVLGPTPGLLDDRSEEELVTVVRPVSRFADYLPHRSAGDFYWQSEVLLDTLERDGQPDYLQLYTHQPDAEQHQSWNDYEPHFYFSSSSPHDDADRIPELYRDFDRFLGRLLPLLDPETLLIVASDHGHSPTIVHSYYTQHRHGPPGILLLWGKGVKAGYTLDRAHILDVLPTIFDYLGLPVAKDLAGSTLGSAFESSSGRKAAIPSYEPFGPAIEQSYLDDSLNAEELDKLRAMGYI